MWKGTTMVGQNEIQTKSAANQGVSVGQSSKQVATYVLNMLTQMATMADMAGHEKLSNDIEEVLSSHSASDY